MGKEKKEKKETSKIHYRSLRSLNLFKREKSADSHSHNPNNLTPSDKLPVSKSDVQVVEDDSLMIKAECIFDYEAQDQDEISIKTGEQIWIYFKDPSGWWTGECNGNYGQFPGDYVKEIEDLTHKTKSESTSLLLPHNDNNATINTQHQNDTKTQSPEKSTNNSQIEVETTHPDPNEMQLQQTKTLLKQAEGKLNDTENKYHKTQLQLEHLQRESQKNTQSMKTQLNEKITELSLVRTELKELQIKIEKKNIKFEDTYQRLINVQMELSNEKERAQKLEEEAKDMNKQNRQAIHSNSEFEMLKKENNELKEQLLRKTNISHLKSDDQREKKIQDLENLIEQFKQERKAIEEELLRQGTELQNETLSLKVMFSQVSELEEDANQGGLKDEIEDLTKKLQSQVVEHEKQLKNQLSKLEEDFIKKETEYKKQHEGLKRRESSLTQLEHQLKQREESLKRREELLNQREQNSPTTTHIPSKPTRPVPLNPTALPKYNNTNLNLPNTKNTTNFKNTNNNTNNTNITKPHIPKKPEYLSKPMGLSKPINLRTRPHNILGFPPDPDLQRSESGHFTFKLKSTGINLK